MLGELQNLDGRYQLRFRRTLSHPRREGLAGAHRARASPGPADIQGEPAEGARLHFVFRKGEEAPGDGEMRISDPPSVLEFSWDEELLRFELEPEGDGAGTVLTFVHTFDELGKGARDAAGWHACLDVLGHELAGEEPPWSPVERWEQVHAEYVERLGPEASMIGPPESAMKAMEEGGPSSRCRTGG
jgi:hypothetical protein